MYIINYNYNIMYTFSTGKIKINDNKLKYNKNGKNYLISIY